MSGRSWASTLPRLPKKSAHLSHWTGNSAVGAVRVCLLLALLAPPGSGAFAQSDAPLSVIDWLDAPAPLTVLPRAPQDRPAPERNTREPAVSSDARPPEITTRPLDAAAPRNVGLVPPAITGMQPDLWAGSDLDRLIGALERLPEPELPAANALLYTVLLAEAAAPDSADSADMHKLTLARANKLMALGAVDAALALVEQAGAATAPALFDLWMQLSLLAGTEDTPCGALSRAAYLTQDAGIRIFCAARAGDWDTAALTFGSAKALALLPRETLDVLDRFLNPDIFEDAAPLPMPRRTDPLTFRLFETIGEPLPTRPLPRAFAVADLRDITGWKSQLEAAERLTRTGALPDNRLLGLYTDRRPAASGGIWERVKAVQRFDAALTLETPQTIAETLPPAWREMRGAQLEVSFATLFHAQLAGIELDRTAATLRARIGLLSPEYEEVALAMPADVNLGDHTDLIRAVARGEATANAPTQALPRAIHDAFSAPEPRAAWVEMAQNRQLGEALIETLGALHDGARGDSRSLREALGTLRRLGLEDTARRASLQILLLERAP